MIRRPTAGVLRHRVLADGHRAARSRTTLKLNIVEFRFNV
jgi:hypothetical protein